LGPEWERAVAVERLSRHREQNIRTLC
jgi:hypothetical protein